MRFVAFCFAMFAGLTFAHAACPAPPSGAQTGWFVEAFQAGTISDGDQIVGPTPVGVNAVTLPVSFTSLASMTSRLETYVLSARVRVCESGPHEFFLYVQREMKRGGGLAQHALYCTASGRVNGSRVVAMQNQYMDYGKLGVASGRITLDPGWADLKITLNCNADHRNRRRASSRDGEEAWFSVRIRTPQDNVPRDLAPNEVVQLGRGTGVSATPGTGTFQHAPIAPTNNQSRGIAPAPMDQLPEQMPERRERRRYVPGVRF